MGDILGGIGRGLLDILGGAHALKRQETEGFDWREQQAQAEFKRQQEREQARQQNALAESQEDARLKNELSDILAGAGEGEQPDLESLLPQNIENLRRQRIIKGALGAGKERKSALQAQKLEADNAKAEAARQARLEVLARTQEGQQALQAERLAAQQEGRAFNAGAAMDMLDKRLGAQRANMEYRTSHPSAGAGGKLRGEFNREIRPYRTQQENFQRLAAAAQDPTGAGDVALIFNYMKMLDPNSVVREGEFATAETVGRSVPVRIQQLYNKALRGERLTDSQRQQIANSGRAQYQSSALPAIRQLTSQYGRLAENSGMDPQDIIGGFQFQDEPQRRPAPGPTGGIPRITSREEYAALPSGAEYLDPSGRRRRKP